MTISVAGVSGSPRRHGDTESLLDAFLEGAEDAGAETEKIVLKNLNYCSCSGCYACHKIGRCIIRDDITDFFDRITGFDLLVVTSPVYSMTVTAELKALIDRAHPFWSRKYIIQDLCFDEEYLKRHKGVFISTAGQKSDIVFDHCYPVVRAFFNGTGFDYCMNIVYDNMDTFGGINGHPTALEDAKKSGSRMVKYIKKL